MRIRKLSILSALAASVMLFSCTNLEEEIRDGIVPEAGNVDVQGLLDDAYLSLQQFQTQDNIWCLQQHTTDETMGPTRGTDWDDNGIWRVLHDHTWDDEHNFIRTSWNSMNRGWYLSNNIFAFDPSAQQEAEARFLRAFYTYVINDHWGQVPMREPGADIAASDPTVMGSAEASDYAIAEMEAALPGLPTGVAPSQGSQNAAHAYLAKMYLNRAVYNSADRANPSFDAADMNKVIEHCDAIINSGEYSLAADFYDNFRPTNDALSSEMIFSSANQGGVQAGNVRSRWFCTLHYNQNPSGWNGFCTIADFYDSFDDPNDVRFSATTPDFTDSTGVKMGLLLGQQVDKDGNDLQDRKGNPLAYTKEVSIFETGDNLEVTGVRVMKYVPDLVSGDNVDNDLAMVRYADVLLMKAEAIARGGTSGDSPASIIDEIRTARGAAANGDGSLDAIIRERGFELYWEGHRRQDLIRFGKFNDEWDQKAASESFRNLFPIPAIELAASPNLVQNPGY